MRQGNTVRNTRTRARIKDALTELIDEKGFEELTVSDLTRRTGINRGTFYLHFVDKYDLLEQLEGEVIAQLEDILLSGEGGERATHETPAGAGAGAGQTPELIPYERVREALAYVREDFAFIAAISGPGGDPQFSAKLTSVIGTLLDEGVAAAGAHIPGDETFPASYAREIALGSVMAIINLWLARGGKESPEQVAAMISQSKDRTPASFVR